MEDILEAYTWIHQHHSEITNGLDPAIFEVNLPPGISGIAGPAQTIFVDPAYESMDELVSTLAHELMHLQDGFFNSAFRQTEENHDSIYRESEKIRRDYENQNDTNTSGGTDDQKCPPNEPTNPDEP